MSLSISVDLSSVIGVNDQLSPQITQAIRSSIQTSLAIVRDRWQSDIQRTLKSTRPLYLQGLDFNSIRYPLDNLGFVGAVELTGKFPNMLESGFPAFDIKIGLGKSSRVTQSKNGGWYITVPFRHSIPGSNGTFGAPMPQGIYKTAKKLSDGQSLKIKGQGDKSWTGYQRKNNTYNGLQRIVKSYQKAKQSQYMTFRRVSNRSDPMSWWHPGYSGVHEVEKLMPFAQSTFVDVLSNNLNGLV